MMLIDYNFRLLNTHHQLLFKWNVKLHFFNYEPSAAHRSSST